MTTARHRLGCHLGLVAIALAAACGTPADGSPTSASPFSGWAPTHEADQARADKPRDSTEANPRDDKSPEEAAKEADKEAQSAANILQYARAPMTAKDLEETLQFARAWRADPANEHARKAWKDVDGLSKKRDESTAGQMREMRQIGNAVNAIEDVEVAFHRLIAKSGGAARHYGRAIRVGAVVAAAEQIARTAKASPTSDRVAELMLAQRAEIASEMRTSLEEWHAANKRGDDDATPVAAFVQGPGAIALAVMPAASFEVWHGLSEAQRAELRGTVKELMTPVAFAGMDYSAGIFLYTAALELAEKSPDVLLAK